MSTEHLAVAASLLALVGQVFNAYLKALILKELAEREAALRREIDEIYLRKEVWEQSRGH
jgi:hypothetical protein